MKRDVGAKEVIKMENKNIDNKINSEAIENIQENSSKKGNKSKISKVKKFMKSRKAKHGSIAVAITAIAVALVFLINIASNLLVERFPNLQIDLTASQTYQLQNDTVEYINQLDTPVTVYVLADKKNFKTGLNAYGGSNYFIQAEKLLSKMDAMSNNIKLEYIDLSKNPTFSGKYPDINWTSANSNYLLLVDAGEKYTALTADQCFTYDSQYYSYGYYYWTSTTIEQAVVTGLLDVTTSNKVKIEFLTGSGQEEEIYSYLKDLLKKNAYDVSEVSLTTGDLSDETQIAVMYGPTVDLSEEATQKLESWLDNEGNYGKTLIYLPIDQKIETPNLDTVIEQYGMKVDDSLAFTTSSSHYTGQTPYMFLTDYAENETYLKTLKNPNIPTIVYNARPINILDTDSASALLSVSSSAGKISFDTDTSEIKTAEDLEKFMTPDGITVAAIGKKTNSQNKSSNVAVFGSYSMFYSTLLSSSTYNNANYIVNLCNTVTNRGDMGITITSAPSEIEELGVITGPTTLIAQIIFIGVVPLTVLLIGLVVFIRRRNK